MKVKICGVTNKDDAVWAINYGADFIGVNFVKASPRHVGLSSAEKWVSTLPSFAKTIGVFSNEEIPTILKTVKSCNLKGVQLHGDETPEFIRQLKNDATENGMSLIIIKAIRIGSEEDLNGLNDFAPEVDYFLLDTRIDGQIGGTGQTFDWNLAVKVKEIGKPIILAGGLNPENVKDAIKKVDPYGVDVASGVEKSPKRKDPKKIQEFIQNAGR